MDRQPGVDLSSQQQPRIERRRTPRAPADFAVHIAPPQQQGGAPAAAPVEARLRDLSTGGLCCLHPDPLREMTLLEMQLAIPGIDEPQRVQGAVVRCVKARGVTPPSYELAVFFTDMAPETRRAIDTYVTAKLIR